MRKKRLLKDHLTPLPSEIVFHTRIYNSFVIKPHLWLNYSNCIKAVLAFRMITCQPCFVAEWDGTKFLCHLVIDLALNVSVVDYIFMMLYLDYIS